MREIAKRPEKERQELFRATAEQMQVHEAIIEKDFWVCWVLDYLFHDNKWKDSMAFKGGTSLSKAFGAIERFSEDIDIILDWKILGYSDDEPWEERSSTQQDIFGKEANDKTAEFLEQKFAPIMRTDLQIRLDAEIEIETSGQIVFIKYPKAFSLTAIQPQIILEIGPLAESVPNEQKEIRPFAAEKFPKLFDQQFTVVKTISAERTFWEKATILHQEAHRGSDKSLPPRYSRHYYDLYRLSCLPVRAKAIADLNLLDAVAQFKMKFYRSPWAKYEDAKPGSLRLLPPVHNISELKKDYDSMQSMLFGTIPSFEEIMDGLTSLENEINKNENPQK
ncbi:MAG: nucleotidyl transferase AbiEii/AbiGii toxin family protein [candidate division Zixibacteria bacterium]|nr:nucleotidyl transferase AbiEii/AbiGii toxin family protein [candidate division Zixibacteria bacterium]